MSQATATAGQAPRVTEAPPRTRRINRRLLRPILMLGGILVVAGLPLVLTNLPPAEPQFALAISPGSLGLVVSGVLP